MKERSEVIQAAIDKAGGLIKLAQKLQLAPSTVSEWRRVPGERVLSVERATGGLVTKEMLRPDLYPVEDVDAER